MVDQWVSLIWVSFKMASAVCCSSTEVLLCLQLVNKLYPHHLGHYLGMDTHDTMVIDRNTPLAPGMVITIEPGLYIPHDYPGDSKMAKE